MLAKLVSQVYTVERIEPLHRRVRNLFWSLKLHNITMRHADGGWGWPEQAPFDGIVVTCAPPRIPEALLKQLALGGRMVIPVGEGREQQLLLIRRGEDGFDQQVLDLVTFVPLVGGAA